MNWKTRVGLVAVVVCVHVWSVNAARGALEIFNPDWSITLTDHGYSDLLFDQRPGLEGREFLSGEWAAAVDYSVDGTPRSTPTGPATWLEPFFVFPDWTTNSDFAAVSPITGTGVFNPDGFEVFSSTIRNADLEIRMKYEFEDTVTGIAQGFEPKSGSTPESITSNRYVLRQTYEIKNITGEEGAGVLIADLELFQFLHGLNSEVAVYDDRIYPDPPGYGAEHYDTTMRGTDFSFGQPFDDTIAFHSDVEPVDWEVGHYGKTTTDDHVSGKPSVGVHLSVEADALSGLDFFDPPAPDDLWVSGAQKYDLPDLAPGETTTFDVLLSISSSDPIPEPSTLIIWPTLLLSAWFVRFYRGRRRRAGTVFPPQWTDENRAAINDVIERGRDRI